MKKNIIKFVAAMGCIAIVCSVMDKILKVTRNYKGDADKFYAYFLIMCQWVVLKQSEKRTENFFQRKDIKKIAIYGMESIGDTLYQELLDTSIEVSYAIDRNADNIQKGDCKIYKPTENLPAVDAIVVTPFIYFKEIKFELQKKVTCPIISIEDVIYDA